MKIYFESEAAKFVGLQETSLVNQRRRGKIAFIKGRPVRYLEKHLIDFLLSQEVPCAANQGLKPSKTEQDALNPPIGMSSTMTEAEAAVALRAVKSARKTMKPKFSSPASYSNVKDHPQENRAN